MQFIIEVNSENQPILVHFDKKVGLNFIDQVREKFGNVNAERVDSIVNNYSLVRITYILTEKQARELNPRFLTNNFIGIKVIGKPGCLKFLATFEIKKRWENFHKHYYGNYKFEFSDFYKFWEKHNFETTINL